MTKPSPAKTKVPPNSKESEMMVLGSMLTNINSLNIAADNLDDYDFYYSEHKIIFQALKRAYVNDRPADIHLIAEELKREEKLQEVGGVNYLVSLAQYAGISAYIEEYTDIVKNKSVLRRMILAAQEVEKDAILDPQDVHTVLDLAQQKFFEISQAANPNVGISIETLLTGANTHGKKHYLEALQHKQEEYRQRGPNEINITGIPTHFMDLDKMIGGFSPSNLMILAARPAMGKTALALNIAEHICFKNSVSVGIFSLEMTADQLLHRIICSQSEVESDKIKTGSLNGSEYQRIVSAVNYMQDHVMIIDDTPGIKITDLRARARRMKETHKIGFLVIDYLQLLSGSGSVRSAENRQNEISEISRMLKILARELNIPILCLSQLSRKVEERQGHRPMMSDLRESGCLTGDTLIKNAETGELHTIKELAERKVQTPIKVFAVDHELKMGAHTLTKAFYSGRKKVYELKTASGRTIKASANHPFLKLEGWTRLDQLKVADRIGMPRSLNTSHSSEVSKNKAVAEGLNMSYCESGISHTSLLQLADSGVYWDKIISITELGEEDVYDATVPGVHNFVANDFIVHNSLEQDSDLVMFLLRREYYDPYDKPGLAELIVAKNRHGGIGNITLTFRKEFAQFANYVRTDAKAGNANSTDAFAAFSAD
ncbi:MAG TPA: replicative DNA helicase [Rhabdochlamydiaceae bacterium]|nr:replicative DNA helicase [Rhabdochlamydiaceae bacterium]